jgi:ribosome biogenesis ATPase
MATRGRPSLQQGLDREVYQVVTTYLQSKNESPLKIRPTTIYDWIKTSNSSLKRRPKKQLADSIERVLAVLQEDSSNDEDDDIGPVDIDGFQDGENAKAPTDIMNKHITSVWAAPSGPATTNGAEGNSSKRIATKAVDERQVKKQKRTVNIDMAPPTYPRLTDVGGSDQIKTQLMELLVLPLLKPQEYALRGLPTSRGVLLHGPPGCGKTFLCRAFAAELGVPFLQIRGPSVVSGMSGESEKQIRDIFTKAKEVAPSIIFIDEIDVIAPKRDSSLSQMDKRIVGQLLVSMDEVALDPDDGKPVIVLAATNRPDAIDPALRRGGRFDDEVNVGVPNETTREAILRTLTRRPKLSDDVDFKSLAKATAGFVAADLESLVSKAGTRSMDLYRKALLAQAAEMEQEMEVDGDVGTIDRTVVRLIRRARNEDMENPPGFENTEITMDSFTSVLPTITPSSKREGFATVPDTTWSDVGALEKVRDELKMAIVEPIKNPQRYERMGISAPTGVLLWGPPGCGKTLLAKAVAAESKANFISVKGPELLNKVRCNALRCASDFASHASFFHIHSLSNPLAASPFQLPFLCKSYMQHI